MPRQTRYTSGGELVAAVQDREQTHTALMVGLRRLLRNRQLYTDTAIVDQLQPLYEAYDDAGRAMTRAEVTR